MLALCTLAALAAGAAAHPTCLTPTQQHNLQNFYVKPVLEKLVDLYGAGTEDKSQWLNHAAPQAAYQPEWTASLAATNDNAHQNRAVFPNVPNGYQFAAAADKPACPHSHPEPAKEHTYPVFSYSPMHYLYNYMMSSAANAAKENGRKDEGSAVAPPTNPWWPYYPVQYVMMDPKNWPAPPAAAPNTTAAPETDAGQSEETETEPDVSAGLD